MRLSVEHMMIQSFGILIIEQQEKIFESLSEKVAFGPVIVPLATWFARISDIGMRTIAVCSLATPTQHSIH